jgi:hypothetical protein
MVNGIHAAAGEAGAAAGLEPELSSELENASFWEVAGVPPPELPVADAAVGTGGLSWAERLAAKRAARGNTSSRGQRKRPRLTAVFAEDPETALLTSSQQELRVLEVRGKQKGGNGEWGAQALSTICQQCANMQAYRRAIRP